MSPIFQYLSDLIALSYLQVVAFYVLFRVDSYCLCVEWSGRSNLAVTRSGTLLVPEVLHCVHACYRSSETRYREFSTPQSFSFCQFSSAQSLSHVWLFATLQTAARQASLFITNSQSLSKLISIELVMPSNHLILCRPLLFLPGIFPRIRVFSNESALCIRWPNYWSFGLNISLSNEHSGLISFRMDWLDLLAVQGTRKSLLQHHSSKASILQCLAFFIAHFHTHTWLLEKP